MKKLNKKQKQLIKEVLIKALHVVCYILSAAFILLMVVTGVQSCSKRPTGVSAEEPNPTERLVSLESTSWYLNDMLNVNENVSYDVNFSCGDGNNYNVLYIYERSLFYERFSPSTITLAYEYDDLYAYVPYGVRSITFTSGDDVDNQDLIDWLYVNATLTNQFYSFEFNKVFNYNAPLNTTIEGVYGSTTWDYVGSNMAYKDIYNGRFYSNGEYFNKVRYRAISSQGNSVLINGEIKDAPTGFWIYSWIEYVNTATSRTIVVNAHDMAPFERNGGITSYYQNSSTWVVDDYRYIVFVDSVSDSERVAFNSFNNNNQTSYSGNVSNTELNNVFTLIASAFTSWIPIFSIVILPGVTLGMLLFVPIVAMLVFAVVRIIKK